MSLLIDNVWKEYGDQIVLERLNMEIPTGEFCAVVGPSGCGKTTFLRMLLGMEKPTRGAMLLDGKPLPDEPGPDRGIVFQRYSVYPHLTVLDNVMLPLEFERSRFFGRFFGAERRRAIGDARSCIASVGLEHAMDKYPSELSGGMQQRLAIAQTLVRRPKILLLDEPFGALDPGTKSQMHDLLLKLWQEEGMTVFMITHDLHEGFKLATRVLSFDKTRRDPQAPGAYGATVIYDLPLDDKAERKPIVEKWKRRTLETQAGMVH
ncbi:ABC transporter ATP-binding protein [Flaviflagellibacter deserti]|uniref:ABC transporter ATP-binding protein n=1 Tax=Flaviflagellibacter deserti TaxID=2267266 RepID=A0ABV9Z414_9HYPH